MIKYLSSDNDNILICVSVDYYTNTICLCPYFPYKNDIGDKIGD